MRERVDKGRMEELREEVGVRESRQGRMEELREEVGERESRQGKNGRTEGGGWCERE